jgi:P27 family predicted phage terminase small subunit
VSWYVTAGKSGVVELPKRRSRRSKGPRAPQHLSKAQRELWREIVERYELELHHLRLLKLLCEALDRAEEARQALVRDGSYVRDRFDQLKPHPALTVERDSRASAAKLARELALDGTRAIQQRTSSGRG